MTHRLGLVKKIEVLQRKIVGARSRTKINLALMSKLSQTALEVSTEQDPFEEFDVWNGLNQSAELLFDSKRDRFEIVAECNLGE